MRSASAHVVIVGNGMGGGTLAWGLAPRGIGSVLPREQENWAINDFYEDLGDESAGGAIQLSGKVQGSMIETHATRVPMVILNRAADRSIEWLVMSEDLPSLHNRVTVDADGRFHVSWRRTKYDRHESLLAEAHRILRKVGYRGIVEQRFTIGMNSHMFGTAVACIDPAASVVDPWCRSHDVSNLFVVDSSFLPSSGAQNPALTIAARAPASPRRPTGIRKAPRESGTARHHGECERDSCGRSSWRLVMAHRS